jgi:hypothetical protein
VLELNQLVQARTTPNGDGRVNVFIGNGQQLVVGSLASGHLTTTPSASDPSRLVVGLKTPGGIQEMPESLLKGGSLGGLLAFRAESLDRVTNDLGRNAASLALTFNAQSSLGQDLLGQSQLSAPPSSFTPDLFVVPPPGGDRQRQQPRRQSVGQRRFRQSAAVQRQLLYRSRQQRLSAQRRRERSHADAPGGQQSSGAGQTSGRSTAPSPATRRASRSPLPGANRRRVRATWSGRPATPPASSRSIRLWPPTRA